MLIDAHAHLDSERYDRDRNKVIRELAGDGIELVIVSGASLTSSAKAVALAKQYNNIYATVGVHPNNSDEFVDHLDGIAQLRTLAAERKVVAIGECGLDYHYDYCSKELQSKWFIEQIRLAKELNLPVVVHDREANIDTYNILKAEHAGGLRGVLHCYSGDVALARKYVELGFYISIAGPITYKSAGKLREVAAEIPLEYLLTETDSPCLTPAEAGKRRNEPMYVRYVAGTIAELKRLSFDKVAAQTSRNAKALFQI